MKNDSPQRSCTSLALGLPTSRGGWQGPGGTAGVWTCRVSDSLEENTTNQLRLRKQNKNRNNLTLFILTEDRGLKYLFSLAYHADSGSSRPVKRQTWGAHAHRGMCSSWTKLGRLSHVNLRDKAKREQRVTLCRMEKAKTRHNDSCIFFFTSLFVNKCMSQEPIEKVMKRVCTVLIKKNILWLIQGGLID